MSRVAANTWRPEMMGTIHMAAAGHPAATRAAYEVLEGGGNAVDAGIAACITMAVVQSDVVNVAGVAPIMIYLAAADEVVTISGLGTWPAAARLETFIDDHAGTIPHGVLRTVVPAAPDAWVTSLRRYGTISFGDAAREAIRLASDGFPVHPLMSERLETYRDNYGRWPSSAEVYLPGGAPPKPGDLFLQRDLGRSLQYMADEEAAAAARGRDQGLLAARDAFYCGDLARHLVGYHEHSGGLLTMEDLAAFTVDVEPPVRLDYHDVEVYACGPWCQGPAMLHSLGLLRGMDITDLGHNSPPYLQALLEAINIAMADRDRFYGDPRFVEVPIDRLMSESYLAEQRARIAGDRTQLPQPERGPQREQPAAQNLDTSYTCVVDRDGNALSATPSDVSHDTPVIPGTGFCASSRGSQSWARAGHPSCIAPGKRPRLTPNPALAIKRGEYVMPFGTPGGDMQTQAMLQAFLNAEVFGMGPQEAVEQPRVATWSFANSFEPHDELTGRVTVEEDLVAGAESHLSKLGYDVEPWPRLAWKAGSVCMIRADLRAGVLHAGADPRGQSYALGR